ncbi:hypothetical protein FQN53_004815 [Emmonsiellopsis sp. PD_33]|nr:hypothetical protein FQN53_004815 [Emmonsiellopsis sp. PD_33]
MLLSVFLFVVSLLVSGIVAQDGFDPSKVKDAQKSRLLVHCPALCLSPDLWWLYLQELLRRRMSLSRALIQPPVGDPKLTVPFQATLTYECKCQDGKTPDVAKYKNTLPFFICQETFVQCIASHPDDLAGQRKCKENQSKCGTINPAKEEDEPTTTAAKSSPTGTEAAATTKATPSATESEPAATSNPAATLRAPQDSSMGLIAAVFLAAFKLFL